MKQSTLYLIMCLIGVMVPWYSLMGFLFDPSASAALFFQLIFANRVSSAVAADLLLSALVAFLFMMKEAPRISARLVWIGVAATLLVGLSFGLPLFLYMRARKLEA